MYLHGFCFVFGDLPISGTDLETNYPHWFSSAPFGKTMRHKIGDYDRVLSQGPQTCGPGNTSIRPAE